MAGPSWLADALAVLMIATAVYCVSRIVAARRWRRPTEYDVDGVHVLMGVAMAGMLAPRLNPFASTGWAAVFGGAVAWFGWQTIRGYRRGSRGQRSAHHLPHLLASGAMLYMLLGLPAARTAGGLPGTSMGGASGTATSGTGAGFPALAFVLALALFGYVIWTTDRLTSLAPVAATSTQAPAAVGARVPAEFTGSPPARRPRPAGVQMAQDGSPMYRPPMSQRLAACCDIVMGLTMGYVLILML